MMHKHDKWQSHMYILAIVQSVDIIVNKFVKSIDFMEELDVDAKQGDGNNGRKEAS